MNDIHYKSVFEQSPIGIVTHRVVRNEMGAPVDFEFCEVNSAFERLTGIELKSVIGKKLSEVTINTGSGVDWIKIYHQMIQSRCDKVVETYSKGLERWFRVSVHLLSDEYVVVWFDDISHEKHELEEKIVLLTSMHDMIFELDEDFIFRNILFSDENLLYISKEDTIGKRIEDLFEPSLASQFISIMENAKATETKQYIRYELPVGGMKRSYEAEIFILNTVGALKYIANIKDVTQQLFMEEALKNKTVELENFFNINLDLLCIADLEGNFIKINSAWEDILGYKVSELQSKRFLDFIHPEDIEATLETMKRLEKKEKVINFVNRYRTFDGSYRSIEWRSIPYGNLIYAAARDITERIKMEEALILNQERMNVALQGTKAGLWDWDLRQDKVYYSKEWKSMLGYEDDEIVDTYLGWKNLWHPDDADRIEQIINDYMSGKTKNFEVDHRLKCKDGKWRWMLTRGELMRDENGVPYRWVGTNIDITYLKDAEDKIIYLSFHDQLTGLYNRRFYVEELKRLNVEKNLPLSLVLADINGLKLVNDAFGHIIGDELIRKTAEVIKRECRVDEVVARIGGDEFIIVLPKTDYQEAKTLVDRILKAISHEKVGILDLSVSFGWATKTQIMEDLEDIFKKAEENMYRHKLIESVKIKEVTIQKMLTALFDRYPNEKEELESVSQIGVNIGKLIGLSSEETERIRLAGLYHDIGKINVNYEILYKIGRLTEVEWNEIRRHSVTGYQVLNATNSLSGIAEIVLHHHERWDGTGYPDSLKGDQIPLESRILAIADAYVAMTRDRAYRKALKFPQVIEEIKNNAGTQFDPQIAMKFIENISNINES